MKKSLFLLIIMSLVCLLLAGCIGDNPYKDSERAKAMAEGDMEKLKKLDDERFTSGYWNLEDKYIEKESEAVDTSDELQKVIYSFDCGTYTHTLTLDYEPLDVDSTIPAYKQKVICTLGEMPQDIDMGESVTVNVEAEYAEQNDYAGIATSCWLYSDTEKVQVTCNDGYSKGEVFAGDAGELGRHDKMSTSFTIKVPDNAQSNPGDQFIIRFESKCGITAFKYKWHNS